MKRALVLLGLFVSSTAVAEPTRVALVDTRSLFDKGGIAKWAAARAKLDAEEPKFVVVESPDGKKPDPHADIDPQFRKMFTDMDRDSARTKAWDAHEHEVLDPIEADVMRALETYTQSHGIAILLDRGQLGDGVLFVAAGADITDAFLKDYNAKAKPKAEKANQK